MKKISFTEWMPLNDFIDKNKDKIIGHTLKAFYTYYWPETGRCSSTDDPVFIETDEFCIVIHYLIPSDLTIEVGSKEEVLLNNDCRDLIEFNRSGNDYYQEEFGDGIKKDDIEGRIINRIEVSRFSSAFECTPQGDMRADGGDYFSTIKLCLDSGIDLCFCGADSICDGYIEIWCI